MGVIVDSREPGNLKKFLKSSGISFDIEQLITGDVICFNNEEPEVCVVIERKRIDDLLSSFSTGRMNEQFERLSAEKFAVLIITGSLKQALKNYKFRVITNFIEEVISAAVIRYNFRSVIWLIDEFEESQYHGFTTMVKCLKKVIDGNLDHIPQRHVKLSKDIRINTLRNLFGLDVGVSKRLLKKYGTVRKVLSLTNSELLLVKGLGPAKLKTIRFILDKSINSDDAKNEKSNDICKIHNTNLVLTKLPGGNISVCPKCIGSL